MFGGGGRWVAGYAVDGRGGGGCEDVGGDGGALGAGDAADEDGHCEFLMWLWLWWL